MDYFVLRRKCHGPEIERFDEERWNEIKDNVTNAMAISQNINDPAFEGYPKIIWDFIRNPFTRLREKIWVHKSDDITQMQKEANEIINLKQDLIQTLAKEIYAAQDAKMTAKKLKQLVNENILNLIKNNADMDKIIPPETEEFDAIRIWIMTNCRMPAGKRIEAIKKNYDNMTWKMFEDFSRENIGSLFEYVIS